MAIIVHHSIHIRECFYTVSFYVVAFLSVEAFFNTYFTFSTHSSAACS